MAKSKQDMIDDLAYAARIISEVDTDFARYLDINDNDSVSIKNNLSGLLMRCILVRKQIEQTK